MRLSKLLSALSGICYVLSAIFFTFGVLSAVTLNEPGPMELGVVVASVLGLSGLVLEWLSTATRK